MSLELRFWGTRGSIPSPGPDTVRYGGNTPCVELRTADDRLMILDAGTGIRELGRSLIARANGASIEGDIFLSHAHWDHIQGLPFFSPAFQRGNRFTIWGSKSLATSIDRVVRDQMNPVVFPIPFDKLDATFEFRELSEDRHLNDGYEVRALRMRHPGGSLGYRFTERGTSGAALSYISDNELGAAHRYDTGEDWPARLVEFVRGSRVLVHDATYTDEEYPQHHGWGHSTYSDTLRLALAAQVETLVLFHHHPDRTDAEIDRLLEECRAAALRAGSSIRVLAAAEGMQLTV